MATTHLTHCNGHQTAATPVRYGAESEGRSFADPPAVWECRIPTFVVGHWVSPREHLESLRCFSARTTSDWYASCWASYGAKLEGSSLGVQPLVQETLVRTMIDLHTPCWAI